MSYERQNSTSRLEQYRARQAERIEAMSRAIDEGRTTVVSSAAPAKESPRLRVHSAARPTKRRRVKPTIVDIQVNRFDSVEWVGSRKSVTAISVEALFHQPPKIKLAAQIAPIRAGSSQAEPRDGQLFSYDAESGKMIPLELNGKSIKRTGGITRRSRREKQTNMLVKAK